VRRSLRSRSRDARTFPRSLRSLGDHDVDTGSRLARFARRSSPAGRDVSSRPRCPSRTEGEGAPPPGPIPGREASIPGGFTSHLRTPAPISSVARGTDKEVVVPTKPRQLGFPVEAPPLGGTPRRSWGVPSSLRGAPYVRRPALLNRFSNSSSVSPPIWSQPFPQDHANAAAGSVETENLPLTRNLRCGDGHVDRDHSRPGRHARSLDHDGQRLASARVHH